MTFIGTVRNESEGQRITGMEIEAADDLAVSDLQRICREAASEFRTSRIALAHRKGRLKVGDVIIVIAVSAPHRSEAFKACERIIGELKKTTPIWKKELMGRKSRWMREER